MQSAFVDIGLERDAFLYVSDFMELEEHDDDLTDVVPANRGVQDLRPQPVRTESQPSDSEGEEVQMTAMADEGSFEAETLSAGPAPVSAEEAGESANGGDSSSRDRGSWRGRRRRRGGRRDGRDRGSDRGPDRGLDRSSESRSARPGGEFHIPHALPTSSGISADSVARRVHLEISALLAAASASACG